MVSSFILMKWTMSSLYNKFLNQTQKLINAFLYLPLIDLPINKLQCKVYPAQKFALKCSEDKNALKS